MTNLRTLFRACAVLCIAVLPALGQIAAVNHLLVAGEHVPVSARSAGIAGAGVAIADGIGTILLNPAGLHSFNIRENATISAITAYNTGESDFSNYNLSGGIGLCLNEILSCGVLYRYLQPGESTNSQNHVTVNVSGRLFDKSISMGVVNYGINATYERTRWHTGPFESLTSYHTDYDTILRNNTISHVDTLLPPSVRDRGYLDQRRLLFDVGVFQDNIGDGLDFGLTFYDLIGYVWAKETPTRVRRDSTVNRISAAPADTYAVEAFDSSYYTDDASSYNAWLDKYYKRAAIAFTFHKELLADRVVMYLPLDFEVFGLFTLSKNIRLSLHTGLELWIRRQFILRFGYARAPSQYPENAKDLTNDNIFSGGAGLRFSNFGIDLYIRKTAWGASATMEL
jgi:hypothetical protein